MQVSLSSFKEVGFGQLSGQIISCWKKCSSQKLAKHHYTEGAKLTDDLLDNVLKLAEGCDLTHYSWICKFVACQYC